MGSVVKYHSVWGRVFGSVSADHGCGFAYGVAVVLVGGRNAYEAREEGDVVVHCGIRDRGMLVVVWLVVGRRRRREWVAVQAMAV